MRVFAFNDERISKRSKDVRKKGSYTLLSGRSDAF